MGDLFLNTYLKDFLNILIILGVILILLQVKNKIDGTCECTVPRVVHNFWSRGRICHGSYGSMRFFLAGIILFPGDCLGLQGLEKAGLPPVSFL